MVNRSRLLVYAVLLLTGAPLTWALVARRHDPVGHVRCPPPDQDWCCALWHPLSYDRGDRGGPLIFYDSHRGCRRCNHVIDSDGDAQ